MCQFFKRLLLPLAMAAVTQTSIVSAEGIRLIGPSGEIQSAPQFSREIVRNTASQAEPSQFFGPTSEQDTLWSIASQLRPSTNVSVQQTLLAIYRLNPQAFEEQNIHSLLPGSTLRIPSLEQVSRASTQEAVKIMEAHQARLASPVAAPAVPARPTVPEVSSTVKEPVPPPAPVENRTPASDLRTPSPTEVSSESVITQADLLALEEKNHRLRLLIAQMQSEMTDLKQELGDETRIRSEVERFLQEERIKNQKIEQLSPSTFEQLLSNGWFVALLSLIPGVLIALLIAMLLSRRSHTKESEAQPSSPRKDPNETIAPMPVEEAELGDLSDELLLDDDIFGSADDSETLFTEEESKEDDIFADLDEGDLDFNLESEEGDDPFASIDDDGDLNPNFADLVDSNKDEAALGLDEMTRALDEESSQDDDAAFELSDDVALSQEDMDSLLATDDIDDDLGSDEIDQALLDDLLAGDDESEETNLDFDDLLDDNASIDPEVSTLSDTKVASDQEIEDLLSQIELQTEELSSVSLADEPLVGEENDDELSIDADSTDLLDEWLDEQSENDMLSNDDLDSTVDQLLDELLGEESSNENNEFDHDSPTLLDEWIDEVDSKPESETVAIDPHSTLETSINDGTEFLDELREIEQQAENHSDFNSDNFIDDLLKSAPNQDPLLDEVDFDRPEENQSSEQDLDDGFDFNPQIEGSETPLFSEPEPVANEFGIPQDDDWLVYDELESASELPEYSEEEALADTEAAPEVESELAPQPVEPEAETEEAPLNIDESELPEYSEEEALADIEAEPELAGEEAAPEVESEFASQPVEPEAETEEAPLNIDESELPEYSEEDALADTEAEPELAGEEPAPEVESEFASQPVEPEAETEEAPLNIDESELPEYSEEDALADTEAEPELAGEEVAPEVESELASQPVEPEAETEEAPLNIDESELPEYSEEDALADTEAEPELAGEEAAPEVESEFASQPVEPEVDAEVAPLNIDESELPEYSEEDALADTEAELELAGEEAAPEVESEFASQPVDPEAEAEEAPLNIDESELPEYSEEDALFDSEFETESDFIFDGEGQPDFDELVNHLDEDEHNEQDSVSDSKELDIEESSESWDSAMEVQPKPDIEEVDFTELASDKFNEQQLDSLLDEHIEQTSERLNTPLDNQTIDSAGMDIEAMLQMGGEDWNGFNLTEDQKATIPDEVPEEDQAIWQPEIQNQQPEVEVENWEHQEDIVDFDPEKSEFMTIDELMAQVEIEEGSINPDEEELKLDVGLDEFPDVIGDITDFDVDSNAEAAGKLDLAKIYMEMNDRKGAIKLLEEAIVDGSDDIRRQAKHLIDVINGRR
ncbi:FimV/HubP family polar landmark protein [Vibrio cincinnatiensis]|uniref:FimV/HubP family polar landmark protein n=1 Tax=Vibrio cincinnatiensis TaxID=675 RepID=UPI001EDE50B0|nr:FimV/HubP family polar landmark protein [Vibrio cincinnatiensis]MCG3759377.1 AAA family ATPase [Vibrio cincinnatiensis]